MVSSDMLSTGLPPHHPWGIQSSSASAAIMSKSSPSSSACLGFVRPPVPTLSSFAAMTPLPLPTSLSTSTSKLHSTKKNYSAEWIDLLSPDSYQSTSSQSMPGIIDPPRSGAVSFSNSEHDKIFTFGGYAEEMTPGAPVPERYVVNDLWQFVPYSQEDDSSSWGWTKIISQTEDNGKSFVPGPRLATAISVLPSSTRPRAVLLGGWDPQTPGTGGVILDDVSMLDLESLTWSQLCASNVDAGEKEFSTIPGGPTSRHVAVPLSIKSTEEEEDGSLKNAICLHNHRCEDHVLLLSTTGDKDKVCAKWECQPTTGDMPSSRGLHCAATLTNKHDNSSKAMVIFGGAAKDGMMSNEAFVLDVNTWKWTKLDYDGKDVPSPRAGACLCSLDEDTVILFGGATPGDGALVGLNDVWALTVDMESGKGKWKCLVRDQNDVNGEEDEGVVRPPGRNAATLSEIDVEKLLPKEIAWKLEGSSEDDSYFLLQGGWYPFRKTYNDIFLLRISSS